ncbi:dTDP-4-dehydrorhamnose reductase [Actinomadura craniellae]|uniref:dTDP-4-dehydrorhamnose reductase n=1 Tax=Actinomadura craniellae TaxID=2231787 RepID=A0A365H0T2_9ACTN|nr:dTDP-4-dehydrorhamnose reductase [Actinomadura craniellae]RAY12690.1 dTDP-4-dehydrorhamnose reductase [Actinomadura craniellae]
MRWLVTGAGGLLGRDVVARLAGDAPGGDPDRDPGGDQVAALDRAGLDVTDLAAVRAAFAEHRPEVVVNCAAYTAVNDAESHESLALRINGDGPRNLAVACAEHGVRLVHISTDYVFPGDARTPYSEDHPPAPRNAYGRGKLAGERAVSALLPGSAAIVRTAWLYGAHGRSFVRTMIDLESRCDSVHVVADQYGQPSWSADVAGRVVALARTPGAAGIFHATNSGEATWFDLAREVFRLVGADPARVRPTTSEVYRTPAPRPAYTVLGHDRWKDVGMEPLRDWRGALHEALSRFGQAAATAGRGA